jgi:ABC-2 type transport system ATP-binding protein
MNSSAAAPPWTPAELVIARAESRAESDSAVTLRTAGLTKRYGSLLAVDGVDLAVRQGEVYGFLGPNGAGKTTTLRMILGLVRPSGGTAQVAGFRPGDPRGLVRIGALVENPAFYPYLSGRENLLVLALSAGISQPRVLAVLELLGLADRADDLFSRYSLGMKQRLGVAAALLKEPEVLVLDEPTNGLDPAAMAEMRGLLRRLADSGKTVLLSSHQLGEVEQICDRVGVILRGKLVSEGTVDELRGTSRLVVRAAPLHNAEAHLVAMLGRESVSRRGEELLLAIGTNQTAAVSRHLVESGLALYELRREERSLEEAFLQLTAEPSQKAANSG